jgi:peptidoglycan/LPS O-acetylase OafA/YrhL
VWVAGILAVCIFLIIDNTDFGLNFKKMYYGLSGCGAAVLGGVARRLNAPTVLRYATDAVLPVYILHQTLIILIGYFVIQWNWPVAAKYPFVVVTVFLSALAIYEIVRRINVPAFSSDQGKKPAVARKRLQDTDIPVNLGRNISQRPRCETHLRRPSISI